MKKICWLLAMCVCVRMCHAGIVIAPDEAANQYFYDAGARTNSPKAKLLGVKGHAERLTVTGAASGGLSFAVDDPSIASLAASNNVLTLNGVAEGQTWLRIKAGGTVVESVKLQCYKPRSIKLSYAYVQYPGESEHAQKHISTNVMTYISGLYAKVNIAIDWTDHGILTYEWDFNGDGKNYTDALDEIWSPITKKVLPNANDYFSNLFLMRMNKDDKYHGGSNGGGTSKGYGPTDKPPRGAMVSIHLKPSTPTQYASTLAHEMGHNLGLAHFKKRGLGIPNLMCVGRSTDDLVSEQWDAIHNTLRTLSAPPGNAACRWQTR